MTAAPPRPPSAPHPHPHARAAAEVAQGLGVTPEHGLSDADVEARRRHHGPNRLPEPPPRALWRRLLDPFRDVMILVLLAAAAVSGLIGDLADTAVILVIVVLNAAIGWWQERRAEQALAALRRMAAPQATVRRERGRVQVVATDQLVPGDVVLLEAGNLVPADLRLHHVAQLRIDESALTGESVTVAKQHGALATPRDGASALPLGDRHNMAYKGTLVTLGRAEGLVVATGAHTELGRIATLLHGAATPATPLQQRLAVFGRRLSAGVLAICALIFAVGVWRGEPVLQMALTAISLAVAAIPEALPAVVTVLLALGARRLVQVQALVRRLPSVETLGSVTVIGSDKTGTLTLNRMRVERQHVTAAAAGTDAGRALWTALVLCNDAVAGPEGWVGDPTETALLEAAAGTGLDVAALKAAFPRRHEWPFDSERKRMATLHDGAAGGAGRPRWCAFVKGAPESVLPRCTDSDREAALDLAQAWAAQGLRVLAVAQRDGDADVVAIDADAFERDLRLLGLVGLIDPPRPEAPAAVAECRAAGIRPVMITGDHPATARAIARQLGIVTRDDAPVLTGAALARLDDTQLVAAVAAVDVYARMDPAQKIRIVRALQQRGEFVAMTGDGVNDAPALKAADIGVAMGRGGTDVAREASSLVLLDDHFATIVAAVREGRRIYDNVRKFVRYALTGNSGEIWVLFLAPLVGLPVPLLPIHILWVNLVTDGLPGLALAAEPAERRVMRRPPRPPRDSLFAHGLWQHALGVGLLIGALCLGLQAWALANGADRPTAQTLVFTLLTFAQMAHILAIRSETESLLTMGLGGNRPLLAAVGLTVALQLAAVYVPLLQPVFRTAPLSVADLGLCVAGAAVVFGVVELEKGVRRRWQQVPATPKASTRQNAAP